MEGAWRCTAVSFGAERGAAGKRARLAELPQDTFSYVTAGTKNGPERGRLWHILCGDGGWGHQGAVNAQER